MLLSYSIDTGPPLSASGVPHPSCLKLPIGAESQIKSMEPEHGFLISSIWGQKKSAKQNQPTISQGHSTTSNYVRMTQCAGKCRPHPSPMSWVPRGRGRGGWEAERGPMGTPGWSQGPGRDIRRHPVQTPSCKYRRRSQSRRVTGIRFVSPWPKHGGEEQRARDTGAAWVITD